MAIPNTMHQETLVLNAFAALFENNLTTKDLVTWKQYDNEMADTNRLRVSEQVGPRYTVTHTQNAVADLSTGVQSSVFGSEIFAVQDLFGASMGWEDFAAVRDFDSARQSQAIKGAASSLAHQIDAYILEALVSGAHNWTGTPGAPVDDYSDFVAGYTRLKEEGVADGDMRGVLSYAEKAAMGANVVELPGVDGFSTSTFKQAFSGAIGGIPTLFTQQLPSLLNGASVTAAVAGAGQNVDYADVAVSGAPGQYKTQTLTVDDTTGLVAGMNFTIADVMAYDERLGAALPYERQFTVTEVVDGTTLRIAPAIIVPGSGSGENANINTAHATVDAAPVDTAVITFAGNASTAYKPGVIAHKDAMVVNTAPLIVPYTGMGSRVQLTDIPVSVRMWKDSDFGTGDHRVRFDVALTANWRDRRMATRISGGVAGSTTP